MSPPRANSNTKQPWRPAGAAARTSPLKTSASASREVTIKNEKIDEKEVNKSPFKVGKDHYANEMRMFRV